METGKRAPSSLSNTSAQSSPEDSHTKRLLGPVDHTHRKLRLYPVFIQHPNHLHARQHAQDAIIPPAGRLRVEVRASVCSGLVISQTWADGEGISWDTSISID